MAKAKRGGVSHKSYYAKYKILNVHDTNAKKRLARALKRNPGNAEQINLAVKNVRRTRHTPVAPVWSATKRRVAVLFKLFTGKVHTDMFNKNEKVSAPAIQKPGPFSLLPCPKPGKNTPGMFSIQARAHSGLNAWGS